MYRDFGGEVGSLSFDYHMYGSDMGSVVLGGSRDDGSSYTILWSKSGDQGNTWASASVTISSNFPIYLKFTYTSGSGYQGDLALDDVVVDVGGVPTSEPTSVPGAVPPPTRTTSPGPGRSRWAP